MGDEKQGRIEAHRHNCRCKGCKAARGREERGEQPRTPNWPPLRKAKA